MSPAVAAPGCFTQTQRARERRANLVERNAQVGRSERLERSVRAPMIAFSEG